MTGSKGVIHGVVRDQVHKLTVEPSHADCLHARSDLLPCSMKRWRLGIIGCGWAGEQHARAMKALANRVELHAVADSQASLAESSAKTWGVQVWTHDYQELLATGELDAVSICLPHRLHAPVAIEAAKAGLHVLVEKPLATTLKEADAMIAAAEEAGITLMVAENIRFDATYQKAAEIVGSGVLGRIFLVRISREHHMHAYLRARPWFLEDPSGGIMVSGGIHDFELVRMLAGEIRDVYAVSAPKTLEEMAGDDTSIAVAGLASGAKAVLVESFSLRTPEPGVHGTVHGGKGSLWFHGDRLWLYVEPELREIVISQKDTFVEEMAHFLDCLDGSSVPLTSAREERKPLVAVVAAYESMRRGRPVVVGANGRSPYSEVDPSVSS